MPSGKPFFPSSNLRTLHQLSQMDATHEPMTDTLDTHRDDVQVPRTNGTATTVVILDEPEAKSGDNWPESNNLKMFEESLPMILARSHSDLSLPIIVSKPRGHSTRTSPRPSLAAIARVDFHGSRDNWLAVDQPNYDLSDGGSHQSARPSRGSKRRAKELQRSARRSAMADTKTILTSTKCFLIGSFFVFIIGSGITLNELFTFLVDDFRDDSHLITGSILLILTAISFVGLGGAFKEDSFILMVYGLVVLVIFFLHVALLFLLKNACVATPTKCYKNMATPPGLAPILVAISELCMAMASFFMSLVIEADKKRQRTSSRPSSGSVMVREYRREVEPV